MSDIEFGIRDFASFCYWVGKRSNSTSSAVDFDPFKALAVEIYNCNFDEVNSKQRSNAKILLCSALSGMTEKDFLKENSSSGEFLLSSVEKLRKVFKND